MGEGRGDAKDDPSVFCVNNQVEVEVEPFMKTGNSRKDLGLEIKNGTRIFDICHI